MHDKIKALLPKEVHAKIPEIVALVEAEVRERDRKMFRYYKSVFEDGFEGGYPLEWDEALFSNKK